ncbi:hypothetical protein [Bacillus alkalicellulosilyticus]|uniref:hypothetical protein n=1 Tax=Alkalihalobacterium alkalicellulosilyticum TaxID=1912214 RepID=UPI0009986DB6|nr:hypothetical protein [Bacillus alkalicellulosilyticus]
MKKIKWIILSIPIAILFIFASTFLPQKVVSINPTTVSKITVFDGNTGNDIEITEQNDINHIITNLNDVTFQKGKPSFMYTGYSFKTTIYDTKGRSVKELTINSNDTISYNGFFHNVTDQIIDYEFIEELVRR